MLVRSPRRLGRALTLFALASLFVPTWTSAVVRRHDVPDAQYVVAASDFPAIADPYINQPGDCLATLIAPEWLITAAHCVDAALQPSADIRVGADVYQIAEILTHEGWNDDKDDISLIRLQTAVPDVTPIPWYTDSDEVGQVVSFVGRGDTSTGDVGGGQPDGQTRLATNTVVNADAYWLEFVFNAPGDPGVTPLEGISGDGDSGGPALIQTAGGLRIAGLSSFQEEGNQAIGTYGVSEFYTRVSRYVDWIEDRVGPPVLPPVDAGSGPDADVDAGADSSGDARVNADAGVDPTADAGPITDAAVDAGLARDAGRPEDAGSTPDAGAPDSGSEPEARTIVFGSRCACVQNRTPASPSGLLSLMAFLSLLTAASFVRREGLRNASRGWK